MLKLEDLVEPYGNMISTVCRRMIQDEDKAQDAAQEVRVNIAASLSSFRGESKISTWIYTITYRVAASYWKKEKYYSTKILRDYFRGPERIAPDYSETKKQDWIREICDKCLTATLHCLDNDSRIAFILKYIVGLSYSELSVVLQENEAKLRKRNSRSKKKLRSFLMDECVLINPEGACSCRMKKLVLETNLPQEYEKVRDIADHIDIFQKAEQLLPRRMGARSLTRSLVGPG